jgi:peptidoglycan/xylan/chitin deacetylase (PgdA/CDA1 family)
MRRRGIALAVVLIVLTVVGVSIALVIRKARTNERRPPVRFSGARTVIPMPSLLPSARLVEPVRVAIVRDPGAASYYNDRAKLDAIIARWRAAMSATGADVRVLAPTQVEHALDVQVLVIPSSPCLGVTTREALERAAARGQGVIATAAAGLYDGGCSYVGYGLIVALTGAARADTLESRAMAYVTIPGGSPLGSDLPPATRIEVDPGAHIALRRPGRDAFYSGYDMDPAPASRRPLLDGAIVHGPYGRGRAVFWGFELDDVVDRAWNRDVLALLVRNSVAWAAGHPLATVEAWPRGQAAAAVLAQDVESEFTNARYALDSLRAAGVPATYFLTSRLALKHRRLTRALAAHGEVGTHTDRHQLLGGAPRDSQAEWLRRTQQELTRVLGRPVAGLRPPEEQFDTATLAEWIRAGGSYVFGANNSRVAAPELLRIGADTVLLLARATDDDVIAVHSVASDPVRELTERYLADFARIRALGGLYLLSYHSQLLARPELVPALARLARAVAADRNVWRATAGEVATWWRARANLRVAAWREPAGEIMVSVHNVGSTAVEGAVLRVVLGPGERVARVELRQLPAADGIARLVLPTFGPGEARTFSIAPARTVNAEASAAHDLEARDLVPTPRAAHARDRSGPLGTPAPNTRSPLSPQAPPPPRRTSRGRPG